MTAVARYVIALVWVLRVVAFALLVTTLPAFVGTFQSEAEPFGSNASAAFAVVSLPLLLAAAAEILALVRKKN